MKATFVPNRRNFLRSAAAFAAGLSALPSLAADAPVKDTNLNVLGPRPGYTPQIGTYVSMLTWMSRVVPEAAKGLTQKDLDYLNDPKANTIGALLLHLSAAEVYYQMNTFEGLKGDPDKWPEDAKKRWAKWDTALELGNEGRKSIKGHDVDYYLDAFRATRETTLAEFRKRDDTWFLQVQDPSDWGEPVNNYCKWFHVCEHISHHTGQIDVLLKRLPGAKPAGSSGL